MSFLKLGFVFVTRIEHVIVIIVAVLVVLINVDRGS